MISQPWKLTTNTTKILDDTCMSAELEQDAQSVVAYFTSEIPLPIGPDEYFRLPGLVLADEVDGATAFLAKSVELTRPDNKAVTKPTDGKKVTQYEFDPIVDEKTREHKETKYDGNYKK